MNFLQHSTDRAQLSLGMTFNVYNDNQGVERILHLDIIPRIISGKDWNFLEKGLSQRIRALNLFIDDIYNEQKVLKDNPQRTGSIKCNIFKTMYGIAPSRRRMVAYHRDRPDPQRQWKFLCIGG